MIDTSFPGPVLCPVDFSELSASALPLASLIGNHCSCTVTALHAQWFELPPYLTPGQTEQMETQRRKAFKEARSALRRFVSENRCRLIRLRRKFEQRQRVT